MAAMKNYSDNYDSLRLSAFWTDGNDDDDDDSNDEVRIADESELEDESLSSGIEFTTECVEIDTNLLPNMNHIQCAAHQFNNLAKTSETEAKKNSIKYAKLHDAVMAKLNSIWAIKNSRLSSEVFAQMCGKMALEPHSIRWMATHAAVRLCRFYLT